MNGRSCVMMGSLTNFSVREVLDVVALSRQHTVIELHREDGGRLTSINLKGGHLVQGESDGNPRQALGIALRAPESCTFQVFRLDDVNNYKSFGQVAQLLTDESALRVDAPAAHSEAPAESAAPAPVMPPTPAVASLPPAAASPQPAAVETTPAPPATVTPMAAATVTPIAPDDRRVSRMPGTVRDTKMRMPVPAAPGLSLAVASPKGGAGKTTISLNLGISLAHRGLRVIVIDGDLNGDLLSLINQRGVVKLGSYDLLEDPGQLEEALRATKVHGLRLLPASGREMPESAFAAADRTEKWRALVREAQRLADVVIVDCPAGVTHGTAEILQSVTHVLGVFQAETVASRSFEMFERGLASLGERDRPVVAGVVVNMLRKDAASARAYETLIASDPSRRVLETAITRSEAFEEAAAAATPVRLHGGEASRKMAWLFDNLAAELVSRLPLGQSPADHGAFLL
jgi:cellulose biosynthesis protein BcsQ